MNNEVENKCLLMVENKKELKAVFKLDQTGTHWSLALLGVLRGVKVDVEKIKAAKALIKEKTGVFSYFRGTYAASLAVILSTSSNSTVLLENTLCLYQYLKDEGFKGCNDLALAAMIIAEIVPPTKLPTVAQKGKVFYDAMKMDHKMRVSTSSYTTALILAMTELKTGDFKEEGERCFEILDNYFPSKTSSLSLGYILAMGKDRAEMKCQKVEDIYENLKARKLKYGRYDELPILGVFALQYQDANAISQKIGEISDFLVTQKGFSTMSVSQKLRLMFASALAVQESENKENEQYSSLEDSTITSLITAQIVLITAIHSKSSAVAVSSASN